MIPKICSSSSYWKNRFNSPNVIWIILAYGSLSNLRNKRELNCNSKTYANKMTKELEQKKFKFCVYNRKLKFQSMNFNFFFCWSPQKLFIDHKNRCRFYLIRLNIDNSRYILYSMSFTRRILFEIKYSRFNKNKRTSWSAFISTKKRIQRNYLMKFSFQTSIFICRGG